MNFWLIDNKIYIDTGSKTKTGTIFFLEETLLIFFCLSYFELRVEKGKEKKKKEKKN